MAHQLTKSFIISKLQEITAALGRPPTFAAFLQEIGIGRTRFRGIFPKWNDALHEAGFPPSERTARSDADLLEEFGNVALELKRIPTCVEMNARSKHHPLNSCWLTFMNHFGDRVGLLSHLMHHWADRPESATLLAAYESATWHAKRATLRAPNAGYVYLMQAGPYFKIGSAKCVKRRYSQLASAIPDSLVILHQIQTADSYGIEQYWFRRFRSKRVRGEWFTLTEDDVKAFCSHSTM